MSLCVTMSPSTTKIKNTSSDPLLSGAQDSGEYRFAVGEARVYHVGIDPTAVLACLESGQSWTAHQRDARPGR